MTWDMVLGFYGDEVHALGDGDAPGGDYKGAAVGAGASGGAAACAAFVTPASAPVCGVIGGKVAGFIFDTASSFFGGDECTGWPCTQVPPEQLMPDMIAKRGQAFADNVQHAYDAWMASPETQALLNQPLNQVSLGIPCGTIARAMESRYIETVRDEMSKAVDAAAAAAAAAANAGDAGSTPSKDKWGPLADAINAGSVVPEQDASPTHAGTGTKVIIVGALAAAGYAVWHFRKPLLALVK